MIDPERGYLIPAEELARVDDLPPEAPDDMGDITVHPPQG